MKKLLILLLFCSLAFASSEWYSVSILAILTSIVILIGIYVAGVALDSNEMKFVSKEEFYQLLVTLVMVGTIAGSIASFDNISQSIAKDLGYSGKTTQALAKESVTNAFTNLADTNENLIELSMDLGQEGSRSAFCSLQGVGFGLSGCGAFRALNSPLFLGSNAIAIGLAELESLSILVKIGAISATTIFLPAGILLRLFKFTRAAGGFLIALGITLYLILPLGIIFIDSTITKFLKDPQTDPKGKTNLEKYGDAPGISVSACNPFWIDETNLDKAEDIFDKMQQNIGAYVFSILIRATLFTVASILIMVMAIRYLSALAGSEVDVTAIAKIA